MKRLKAESDAADKARRLQVAQEQLAEYAFQKQADADSLLQQAEKLKAAHLDALALPDGSVRQAALEAVTQELQTLTERIADAASEAKAFALQQAADVETLKRSSRQVSQQPYPYTTQPPGAHGNQPARWHVELTLCWPMVLDVAG